MSLWTTQTRAELTSGTSRGQTVSLGTQQWSTNCLLESSWYCNCSMPLCTVTMWTIIASLSLTEAPLALNDATWCNKPTFRHQVVAVFLMFVSRGFQSGNTPKKPTQFSLFCFSRGVLLLAGWLFHLNLFNMIYSLAIKRPADSLRECHLLRCAHVRNAYQQGWVRAYMKEIRGRGEMCWVT